MRQNPIVDYLMERRTLLLEGPINERMLKDLRNRMLHLEQQDPAQAITINIDCGGGETFPSLHFCDFIEFQLKVPVHGVVTGLCGSSATFILLHCVERSGFPHSRFLIHSSEMGGVALKTNPASRTIREQLNADLEATHEQVTQMYMRKLKLSREEVESLTQRGEQAFNAEMWAPEALKIGLIQKIVVKEESNTSS